jgi:hypothetical protein
VADIRRDRSEKDVDGKKSGYYYVKDDNTGALHSSRFI